MTSDCRLVGSNAKLLTLIMCRWLCYSVNVWHGECDEPDGGKRGTGILDNVLMLPFSCSNRPGVCITKPNCKARSDGGEGRGPSWLVANEAFSLKSASVRWAGWATVTYGRVGKLKTRVGKREKFFGASRRILPTLAWNPTGAPACGALLLCVRSSSALLRDLLGVSRSVKCEFLSVLWPSVCPSIRSSVSLWDSVTHGELCQLKTAEPIVMVPAPNRSLPQGRRQGFRPGWAKFGAKRRKIFFVCPPWFSVCPPCHT